MDVKFVSCQSAAKRKVTQLLVKSPFAGSNCQVQNPKLSQFPLNAHKNLSVVSFGRSLEEHRSWGAYVDPVTKNVNFKTHSFHGAEPVQAVYVEIRKPEKYNEKNPDQKFENTIKNSLGQDGKPVTYQENSKLIRLKDRGEGVFETNVPADEVKPGDQYRFVIVYSDGYVKAVKDPYSNKQEGIFSWSTVMDHSAYKWSDQDWQNNKTPEKLSRIAGLRGRENLTPLSAMNQNEIHLGTISDKGTFEAAKKEVDRIKDLGFNTINVMPVENCYDINWGYDGVDKFAPNPIYGSPEKLKELIDYAHQKKMNIIMDVVPNHVGPEGNALNVTGHYKKGQAGWGDTFNYEGFGSKNVRDYIVNLGRHYLGNYHCDGLRLDMTSCMDSDYTIKLIAQELNYHHPDAVLIAEDGREAPRTTKSFDPNNIALGYTKEEHCADVARTDSDIYNKMSDELTLNKGLGMDSEWGFQFHHKLLANTVSRNADLWGLLNESKSLGNKLKYPMSHDEIGNIDGTRLIHKSLAAQMNLFESMKGSSDCEKGQKAAQTSYELCKAIATGDVRKMSDEEFNKFTANLGINRIINRKLELYPAFNNALAKHKTALGYAYTTPGPVMLFQGDESANLDAFRFFRLFPDQEQDAKNLSNKGYEPGMAAYSTSKIGHIKCDSKYKETMKQTEAYTKALNKLASTEAALIDGYITNGSIVHEDSDVIGVHTKSKDGSSEIFSVSNFAIEKHPENAHGYDDYRIEFPQGQWKMVINSDEKQYGGSGRYVGSEKVVSTHNGSKQSISLPANGTVVFKKVG